MQEGKDTATKILVKQVVAKTAFVIWKLHCAASIRGKTIAKKRAVATLHNTLSRMAKTEYAQIKLLGTKGPKALAHKGLFMDKWKGLIESSGTGRLSWIPSDHC